MEDYGQRHAAGHGGLRSYLLYELEGEINSGSLGGLGCPFR